MPIIVSDYKTPFLLRNGHIQTLLPALFRKKSLLKYERERLATPDDDFLDIDRTSHHSNKLVFICHGLEGSSRSTSVIHTAEYLFQNGYDVAVMNFRSCGGEMNRQLRFYHSGETGDLDFALRHLLSDDSYEEINLIGFSLGGNVVLKYIGENGLSLHPKIKKAVVFSVPCHLESSALYMRRRAARIYMNNFLQSLKAKIIEKHQQMPSMIAINNIGQVKTFHDFDGRYTGPIHGFADAHDYYTKSSSVSYLRDISIPTLMVNAKDDPFLPDECYPAAIAETSKYLHLEIPDSGGHVGFMGKKLNGTYWSEKRALAFLSS